MRGTREGNYVLARCKIVLAWVAARGRVIKLAASRDVLRVLVVSSGCTVHM